MDNLGSSGWLLSTLKKYPGLGVVKDPEDCLRETSNYKITGSTVARQTTSYSAPKISSIAIQDEDGNAISHMNTLGGDILYIIGQNFGPVGTPVQLVYGSSSSYGTEYEAQDCIIVQDFVKMKCLSAPGIGKDNRIAIV